MLSLQSDRKDRTAFLKMTHGTVKNKKSCNVLALAAPMLVARVSKLQYVLIVNLPIEIVLHIMQKRNIVCVNRF